MSGIYPVEEPLFTHQRLHGGLGIGLAGAHRTGKTTVAKKLAEANDFPLVSNIGSELAAKMGLDFSKPIRLIDRIEYQNARLDLVEKAIVAHSQEPFIMDRTPLDLAAYMLADVPTEMEDEAVIQAVNDYVNRCFDITNRHFCVLTYFRPTIPYKPEPGKPVNNAAYQQKISTLIAGLLVDVRQFRAFYAIPYTMNGIMDRVGFVAEYASSLLTQTTSEVTSFPAC